MASGHSATRPKAASEGWMTSIAPHKAHRAGGDAAGADLIAKQQVAKHQQDERLDKDDRQSVGDAASPAMPETKA